MIDHEDVRPLLVYIGFAMRFEEDKAGGAKQQRPHFDKEKAELPPFFIDQNRNYNKGHADQHGSNKEHSHPGGIDDL